jgi:integrase
MGRRRTANVSLPEGVQAVKKPSGKTYYYHAPHRGTDRAGPRVALGTDPHDPEFWRKLHGKTADKPGSFDALILDYKSSPEWARLRPASKSDYAAYLDRLQQAAGDRMVSALAASDIYQMRDAMMATPHAANHMLSILRTLLKFAVQRNYRTDNPAIGLARLLVEDNGARPWPQEGYQFVISRSPLLLQRAAFLGRATGQRAGDLVRMRPVDLAADGINVRIGKRREKEHFVPLTAEQMREIRSWGVADLDLFIKSPAGQQMTAHHLGAQWARWRASEAAAPIRDLKMTLHGLRATAVADRQMAGTADSGIAAELGMSVQMVTRYSRFADKTAQARASRDRREHAKNGFGNSVVDLKTR